MRTHADLSSFKNKHILITGANGYIGSSVTAALKIAPGKLTLFTRKNGDVTNRQVWRPLLKDADIVFHFAGQTSAYFANANPVEDVNVNVLPVVHMIETCRALNRFPHIIFAGTVTQAGKTDGININESFPDNPVTVYDINKLTAEKYLKYYSTQIGGSAVTLRLANIYGPGPSGSKPDRGIVNLMVVKALKGEPITVFGTGKYIRDYVYIDDTVNAFLSAASSDKTKGKHYVIGTGTGHTILDMAGIIKRTVKRMTGKDVKITHVPFPENASDIEFRNFTADSSTFKKDTGWEATTPLEEGIEKTVQYFRNLL